MTTQTTTVPALDFETAYAAHEQLPRRRRKPAASVKNNPNYRYHTNFNSASLALVTAANLKDFQKAELNVKSRHNGRYELILSDGTNDIMVLLSGHKKQHKTFWTEVRILRDNLADMKADHARKQAAIQFAREFPSQWSATLASKRALTSGKSGPAFDKPLTAERASWKSSAQVVGASKFPMGETAQVARQYAGR